MRRRDLLTATVGLSLAATGGSEAVTGLQADADRQRKRPSQEAPQRKASMMKSRYATLSQVKLHYLESGFGDVIVLLHGWPHTSHGWRHVMPKLSQKYRVIAPDLRGLGDSSRPASGYDNASVGKDVIELMDSLGAQEFSLVGHDWGGPVAFAMTLLARKRVKKLALVDTVLAGDGRSTGSGQGGARWEIEVRGQIRSGGRRGKAVRRSRARMGHRCRQRRSVRANRISGPLSKCAAVAGNLKPSESK